MAAPKEGLAYMRRRNFLAVLAGSATLAWPLATRAQHGGVSAVGFLRSSSRNDSMELLTALRQGLKTAGVIEGQDIVIEERYAENIFDRLPALATDLVQKKVAVIVGNSIAATAAKAATTSIPIVFITGTDPVRDGMVASLNRPGSNVTGVAFLTGALGAKRLELLRQMVPRATGIIAVLVYPNTPETEAERRDLKAAATAIGQQLIILEAKNDSEVEAAFASLRAHDVGALIIGTGTFMFSKRELLVRLANRLAIPAMFAQREAAKLGGLMSYGTSIRAAYREAGAYVARILHGEKPAEMPVIQSTKFEFVINMRTAKKLGLEFHPQLLATADEVIE